MSGEPLSWYDAHAHPLCGTETRYRLERKARQQPIVIGWQPAVIALLRRAPSRQTSSIGLKSPTMQSSYPRMMSSLIADSRLWALSISINWRP